MSTKETQVTRRKLVTDPEVRNLITNFVQFNSFSQNFVFVLKNTSTLSRTH